MTLLNPILLPQHLKKQIMLLFWNYRLSLTAGLKRKLAKADFVFQDRDGSKWFQKLPNSPTLSQMVPNGLNGFKMVPNDLQWSQAAPNVPNALRPCSDYTLVLPQYCHSRKHNISLNFLVKNTDRNNCY